MKKQPVRKPFVTFAQERAQAHLRRAHKCHSPLCVICNRRRMLEQQNQLAGG